MLSRSTSRRLVESRYAGLDWAGRLEKCKYFARLMIDWSTGSTSRVDWKPQSVDWSLILHFSTFLTWFCSLCSLVYGFNYYKVMCSGVMHSSAVTQLHSALKRAQNSAVLNC